MEQQSFDRWIVYELKADGNFDAKMYKKPPKGTDLSMTRRLRIPVPPELSCPVVEARIVGLHPDVVRPPAASPPAASTPEAAPKPEEAGGLPAQ